MFEFFKMVKATSMPISEDNEQTVLLVIIVATASLVCVDSQVLCYHGNIQEMFTQEKTKLISELFPLASEKHVIVSVLNVH